MELLRKLTQCSGASGREENISEVIKNEIKSYCDEIFNDPLGSLIVKKGTKGKKILVCAHMDEIGVVVTYKDDKGFFRFAPVGGLRIKDMMGRRVIFADGTIGVVGVEHGTEKYTVDKMFIDTGNKGNINVGDMGVFVGDYYENGTTVISKALDNRVGCYVAIEAMKRIENPKNEIYFMFTVQEEVGLRGAKTAAFGADADYALAIDVTDVGDTPSDKPMAVKLGGGAAIKVMDRSVICHCEVRNKLIELAANKKIPYQLEVLTAGGTDAGAVHTMGAGIKTGAISIPTRYIHSPSEMADKDDIENCINLLVEFLEN